MKLWRALIWKKGISGAHGKKGAVGKKGGFVAEYW
jgi:hypothetical protein